MAKNYLFILITLIFMIFSLHASDVEEIPPLELGD